MPNSSPSFGAIFIEDVLTCFRVSSEVWKGFYFLRGTKRCVSIFGSARLPQNHIYCILAQEMAHELAKKGFTVMTGGGPGIMEAANRGATEGGGSSIGVNIVLPYEQKINPFVKASLKCRYFFVRKLLLVRYSDVFIFLPGGFGTLDEFFEVITLLQTGRTKDRPVILMGKKYWNDLLHWCRHTLIPEGTISEEELSRIQIVDTVSEAMDLLPEKLRTPDQGAQG